MPCSATPTSTSTATRRRQLHLRGGTAAARHRERGQRRARVREEAVVAGKPLPQPSPPPTRDFSTDDQSTRDRSAEACARAWPAQNPRVDWARTIGTRGAPSPQGRGRRLVSRGKAAPQDLGAPGQGPTAQGHGMGAARWQSAGGRQPALGPPCEASLEELGPPCEAGLAAERSCSLGFEGPTDRRGRPSWAPSRRQPNVLADVARS